MVHLIEFTMPGNKKSFVMGITVISYEERKIESVIMTIEGFVFLDAYFDQKVVINRGIPPFDSINFATGMMDDIKLMFFKPEGCLVSFGNTFFPEDIKKVFEIEVKKIDEDELTLEYDHCPLVTAWQQIDIEGEMLERLCDIAMSDDRGISSRFEDFEFKLGKTIAKGHKVCEVCFTRNKQMGK